MTPLYTHVIRLRRTDSPAHVENRLVYDVALIAHRERRRTLLIGSQLPIACVAAVLCDVKVVRVSAH